MKYLIYGLIDPRDGQLRYVGRSSSGLARALHHSQPRALRIGKTRCTNWCKNLKNNNLRPEIVILESWDIATNDELNEAEIFWIAYFRGLGCSLVNHTLGGGGLSGHRHSEEHKLRISESVSKNHPLRGKVGPNKGRKFTPEQIERFKNGHKHQCKPVIRNDGKYYASTGDAARELGICKSRIAASAKTGSVIHKKFRFAYV